MRPPPWDRSGLRLPFIPQLTAIRLGTGFHVQVLLWGPHLREASALRQGNQTGKTFPTPEPWVPGRVLTCSLNSLPLQASTPEARFREMVGLFKFSSQAMSKVHFKYILSDPMCPIRR